MKTKATTLERFSDLPDLVAHHILSFLTFTDLTRFGATSKKCRELYLSAPSLNFEVSHIFRRSTTKRTQLFRSVERFLLHRGNNPILRFRICWVFQKGQRQEMVDDEQFRLASWIQNAVIRCNVQDIELDLTLNDFGTFFLSKVSSCIWNSTSLRSLEVASKSRCMIFQVPSFSLSCNLYSLTLRNVRIEDENFGKWISCCCKCIKQLWLDLGYGQLKNLTIESSSLRSFSLLNVQLGSCHLKCEKLEYLCLDHFGYIASLNISVPNLKHFIWRGKLTSHLIVGDLMSLEKVELSLRDQVDDFDNLLELFSGIRRTKVLNVDWYTLKAVSKEGLVPLPLDEIRKLDVHINSLDDDMVLGMVSLLRGMTNLNTLWITTYYTSSKFHSKASEFNVDFWKSQGLAFVSQLKEVRMEFSNGSNEIELIRYILDQAPHLKNMVILYPPQQFHTLKIFRTMNIGSTAKIVLKKRKK